MSEQDDLVVYTEALKKFNELILKIKSAAFEEFPDILKEKDLKNRIKEIDTTQKRIDDIMIQFKKLFTEKLLVLTAMRSLLWHINTTISDSEEIKEIKDRIRIFILPELERFLNSFKREINILEQRINPVLDYFDNVREAVNSTKKRHNKFNLLTDLNGQDKLSNLEKMLNLILEGKLEEFNSMYNKSGKEKSKK